MQIRYPLHMASAADDSNIIHCSATLSIIIVLFFSFAELDFKSLFNQ